MQNAVRRKKKPILPVLLLAVIVAVAGGVFYFIDSRTPSKKHLSAQEYFGGSDASMAVTAGGEVTKDAAVVYDGATYISEDAIAERVDPSFYYEENEKLLVVTTPTKKTTLDLTNGSSPNKEAEILDGTVYVSVDFLKQWADAEVTQYDSPSRLVIKSAWTYPAGDVSEDAAIRESADIKAPIIKDVSSGDTVRLLDVSADGSAGEGKQEGFTKVESEDGYVGYISDKYIKNIREMTEDHTSSIGDYTTVGFDGKINMVFHQTTSQASNNALANSIANVTGVNVIAPTWFFLDDKEGGIQDLSSADYVATAHSAGMKVWAVLNDFDGNVASADDTAASLSTDTYRSKIVDTVMQSIKASGADGLNIDMEHVTKSSVNDFLELIREFSVECRNAGITLSVDDYVPTFTGYMNRAEQARVCDYIVTMCYDEHSTDSEEAGSVSSLSFVKKGIEDTLKTVPAEKTIAAIPFFTRLWTTAGGKVTSTAYGMTDAENAASSMNMSEKWDDQTGQTYCELTSGDTKYQMWLENEKSIGLKMEAVQEAGCAGVAEWKLGLEKQEIWEIISNYLA